MKSVIRRELAMPPDHRGHAAGAKYAGVFAWGFLALYAVAPPAAAWPVELQYTSPLSGYRAYDEQPVESWREANERVGRIGGWRAYARETMADPAEVKPAAADAHAGHHGGTQDRGRAAPGSPHEEGQATPRAPRLGSGDR